MAINRVLFLHKFFTPDGGIERVHQNLATALARHQVQSFFYVYDTQGESRDGFKRLAERYQAFSPTQDKGFVGKLRELFACIEAMQVEVLISATETANMLACLCALRYPRLSVIYTRHCALDVSGQKLPPWAIKLLYNCYALTNRKIVAVSQSLSEQLRSAIRIGRRQVDFIPNAVVDGRIFALAKTNTQKLQLGDYYCAVGRLVRQKGFDMLIDAYAMAKWRNPALPQLVIVGSGELQSQLMEQAERRGVADSVVFTGFVDNPYYIIKHAKAFILSSRHEGMPTVLVEAMALDTPVIAFDCPTGPRELLGDNQFGVLVAPQDVPALSQALLEHQQRNHRPTTDKVLKFHFDQVARAYMQHF
ncbi:glycosyltransferase [Bowmanella dokdonensis]|uniref:Glycosyltransferase n=1 Tax=Bowmanella dokdonensis TaxID=751969 RepID=A0A939DLZ3_9ALTE|nr:glycosyltransferase [Bowmanella dokdonensis]MBN7824697.1 glycosyltransferase [Bowmanella dokdonensis]